MLLDTLKVLLHIVTVFAAIKKVLLLTFFLPKSKSVLLGILYRPPDKLDFVKKLIMFHRNWGFR